MSIKYWASFIHYIKLKPFYLQLCRIEFHKPQMYHNRHDSKKMLNSQNISSCILSIIPHNTLIHFKGGTFVGVTS